ncbi:MAG: SulP family inorganic anion transporter [Anaerolineae bacterium]
MAVVPPPSEPEPIDEAVPTAASDDLPNEQPAAAEPLTHQDIRDELIAEGDAGTILPSRFITVPRVNLDRRKLVSDLIAGATFAAVNIPQSLGHGQIAGVNPVFGLYTLMFAMPVAAIFTSSVFMNVSTTSALAVATQSSLSAFPSGTPITQTLIPLVLLVGLFQLLFGVFRLGFLMRFVSRSVMVGFMTGVAVLIILGQISDLTGFNASCELCSNKVIAALDTILNLRSIQMPSLFIGLLTMALIFGLNRTPIRKFSMVIAIISASALVQILGLTSVELVGQIATLPDGLPAPTLPVLTQIGILLPAALAVSIVGLVQGAAISQAYVNPNGKFPNVSRDFIGQGIANMVGSVFSGIPAGGSASGTALIVSAGMQSRWANIFAGLFVILGVLLLAPLIGYLAMPALAGLLIVVGIQLIDVATVRAVLSTGAVTATALGVTFATTMILPLQYAVFVGVGVSIMLNVFRQSNKVRVVEWRVTDDGGMDEIAAPKTLTPGSVTVLYIYGELASGGAPVAEKAFPDLDNAPNCVLIIGLRGREDINSTFIQIIERTSRKLAKQNSRLMLSGVSDHVYLQLVRTGAMDVIGRDSVFKMQPRIHASVKEAIAAGHTWLDRDQAVSTSASATTGSPG